MEELKEELLKKVQSIITKNEIKVEYGEDEKVHIYIATEMGWKLAITIGD